MGVSGVAVVWEDESSGDAPPSCAVKSLASNRLLLPVVVVALAVPPPSLPATSTAMAMASLTTSSVISFHHCAATTAEARRVQKCIFTGPGKRGAMDSSIT